MLADIGDRLGRERLACHAGPGWLLGESDNLPFLAAVPDASVRLVVTSPPYNVGKEYEARLSPQEWLAGQERVIAECVRAMRPDGAVCWQTGNMIADGEVVPLDILLYPVFKRHGLKLRNRIVWHYEHGLHCTRRLSHRHETILWFTRDDYRFDLDPIRVPQKYPGKKPFKGPNAGKVSSNPLGKNPGDVWIFPNVKGAHPEKTEHPAQYPVELVERLVLATTEPGDAVLDPYVGSGTSLLAAVRHGRLGLGVDREGRYVRIALGRLAALAAGTLRTRPMGKPVLIYPCHGATVPADQ